MLSLFHSRIDYFIRCAEAESLREAAIRIGVSQSALSLAIKGLEEELGAKVFERSSDGIRLTVKGATLLNRLKAGRNQLERDIFRLLHQPDERALKVGAVTHFALNQLIPALKKNRGKLPKIQLSLTFSLHSVEAVKAGKLDFAFVFWSTRPRGIKSIPIRKDPSAIVGLKKRFAHIEKATSMSDLRSEPWIHQPKPQYEWTQMFDADREGYVVRDMHAGRQLILMGLGISDTQVEIFTPSERKRLAFARNVPSRYKEGMVYAVYREDIPPSTREHLHALLALL